jgi:NitT/TauT family transport system ATP-binding protein
LGSRVIVFTVGPARMADNIEIKLPEPRTLNLKTTKEFGDYTQRIYQRLEMR